MKDAIVLQHRFVEFIPSVLEERTLYISMRFGTASHLCVCGCGNKVVTPIRPTDWTLIYDGKSVSLDPSIGNWSFACRSHYWIKKNKIRWGLPFSEERIAQVRAYDRSAKDDYFGSSHPEVVGTTAEAPKTVSSSSAWNRLKQWWNNRR